MKCYLVGIFLWGVFYVRKDFLYKKSKKTHKTLLILAGLVPFFITEPAIAQVAPSSLQTVAVATAAQPTTDAATQKKIDELIGQLGSKDEYERRDAARCLGKIGLPAIQILIKALEDAESEVRRLAARSLGQIGDPQAIQPLIKALGDENERVRQAAATALGKIDDKRAVKPLRKALTDEDQDVRIAAKEALQNKKRRFMMLIDFLDVIAPFAFIIIGLVVLYFGLASGEILPPQSWD